MASFSYSKLDFNNKIVKRMYHNAYIHIVIHPFLTQLQVIRIFILPIIFT